MMVRTQILLPPDLLESAKLYAASRKLSLSELIRHSVAAKIKPKKKMSFYAAMDKLSKIMAKKKIKLPADFATNDKYLYQQP